MLTERIEVATLLYFDPAIAPGAVQAHDRPDEEAHGRVLPFSREISHTLAYRRVDGNDREVRLFGLTGEEHRVLGLIAVGYEDHSIAALIGTPQERVEEIADEIYRKLQIPDDGSVDRRVRAATIYLAAQRRL
ncbi:MAG: hypothetical protein ACOC5K_01110 [Chloroflexota bacterium]